MNEQLSKRKILRLWLMQLGITGLLVFAFALFYSSKAAVSALLGGLVYIIPNAYFAYKVFKYQGARAAKHIVNSFYKGEAVKILISILLFTLVFVCYRVTPVAFFVSYIVILMTHWLTPLLIDNK